MYNNSNITLLAGGFVHCSPSWDKKASAIDQCYKIYYPISGTAQLRIQNKNYKLEKGKLYFISGYKIQSQQCKNSMQVHWIHFVPESLYLNFWLSQFSCFEELQISDYPELEQVCDILQIIFTKPLTPLSKIRENAPIIEVLICQAFLLKIITRVLGNKTNKDQLEIDPAFMRLQPAVNYMNQRFRNPPQLDQIAKQIHLAPNYFHRIFKSSFGISPFDYMLSRRMNHARHLLNSTNLIIKEVAIECGYECPYYFSLSFKKHFGLSPSEMRKRSVEISQ